MTRDLVIYGTGGTSRDLLETIELLNAAAKEWNILGFVDDDPTLHGTTVFGYPVLGGGSVIRDDLRFRSTCVTIGVGNDRNLTIRKRIRARLNLPDARFPAIVHPSVVASSRAFIGPGAFLSSGVFCSGEVRIGAHVIVLQNTVISHDTVIADFATLSAGISAGGGVRIEGGAYIGMGAALLPGVTIGPEARVGLGAVVIRNVDAGVTVAGNPARPIRSAGGQNESAATVASSR